jgi:hypothetical protein
VPVHYLQGKWVVAAQHACNEFISQFDNALIYTTPEVPLSETLLQATRQRPLQSLHSLTSAAHCSVCTQMPCLLQNSQHRGGGYGSCSHRGCGCEVAPNPLSSAAAGVFSAPNACGGQPAQAAHRGGAVPAELGGGHRAVGLGFRGQAATAFPAAAARSTPPHCQPRVGDQ